MSADPVAAQRVAGAVAALANRTALVDLRASRVGEPPLRVAFGRPCQVLVAHEMRDVAAVIDAAHQCSIAGAWCVGYVRYEAAGAFDAGFETHVANGPLAWFAIYDEASAWGDSAGPGAGGHLGQHAPMTWTASLRRAGFDERIGRIHEAIADGEVYQVNLTSTVTSPFSGDAAALFDALHRAQPDSYAVYLDTGDEQILSVSPELFFEWRDGALLSRPMKGTAARGESALQDEINAALLGSSVKERAENLMIVDLIRNDMSRIAVIGSVQVPRLFETHAWPTVWQMTSDVTSRPRPGTLLSDIFRAMFPCGSITGAPKMRAMHWIRRLEDGPRGVYCGAIGVLQPGGAATFSVAIRTVVVKDAVATCGIGSGITADAHVDAEWEEWRNKRRFIDRAAAPFELLETMRLQDGLYAELDAHLHRAARAAAHFGFYWDEAAVRAALSRAAGEVEMDGGQDTGPDDKPRVEPDAASTKVYRTRLLIDRFGHPTVTVYPLTDMTASPTRVAVSLAARAFDAADSEFVRCKTTRREHYDAFAPLDEQVFDTLLWNVQGEITEFTRGNVALLIGGRWVTPPLRCGLLAGVGRARLLADGTLVEQVVRVQDLPRVTDLAFINALRGWLPATLAQLAKPDASLLQPQDPADQLSGLGLGHLAIGGHGENAP